MIPQIYNIYRERDTHTQNQSKSKKLKDPEKEKAKYLLEIREQGQANSSLISITYKCTKKNSRVRVVNFQKQTKPNS